MPGSLGYTQVMSCLAVALQLGPRSRCPPSKAWAGGQHHSGSRHHLRWPLSLLSSLLNRGPLMLSFIEQSNEMMAMLTSAVETDVEWAWVYRASLHRAEHTSPEEGIPLSAPLVWCSVRNPPPSAGILSRIFCCGKIDNSLTVDLTCFYPVVVCEAAECIPIGSFLTMKNVFRTPSTRFVCQAISFHICFRSTWHRPILDS